MNTLDIVKNTSGNIGYVIKAEKDKIFVQFFNNNVL